MKCELSNIIKCSDEAKGKHESSLRFPIAQVEVEKQNKWFHTQMTFYSDYIGNVKYGLLMLVNHMHMLMLYVLNMFMLMMKLDQRILFPTSHTLDQATSQLSRVSATSSARIKAEAEKAALVERVAALKKKTSSRDTRGTTEERKGKTGTGN